MARPRTPEADVDARAATTQNSTRPDPAPAAAGDRSTNPMIQKVMAAIDSKMALEGGQLLRSRRTENGRMQYWVQLADGKTIVGSTAYEVAQGLGIKWRDVKNMEKTISVARAATITGFSANTIIRYTNEGQIRHEGE